MCKKFCKSWLHGLWDYNVWSGIKSFFLLCLGRTADFDHLWCKNFQLCNFWFCTIIMHIMLGTCTPNLRGRWWVEHTQMHPVLKKGTKNFHYTSISCGIFLWFHFFMNLKSQQWIWRSSHTLNLAKIKFGNKWNLQAPWGMEDFTSKYRGKVQKIGEETLKGFFSRFLIRALAHALPAHNSPQNFKHP
jgi:hypothetical protein